jgi:hypothetical protein
MSAKATLKIKDAVSELRDQLDRIRGEVAQLREQLEIEASRPVPSGESEARIEATVERLRGFVANQITVGDLILPDGRQAADYLSQLTIPPFGIAAIVAPDQLRRWLRERATAVLETLPEPVEAAVRRKRIAALEARLRDAEASEAGLCWQALEAGIDLDWRGDLSPLPVLGLENAA